MWTPHPKTPPDWSRAQTHLAAADPVMRLLIAQVGPCLHAPLGVFPRSAFPTLCKSIFSQQISTAAAASILARFRTLFPHRRPTPALVLKLTDTQLRSVGLSRQKVAYLRDLAQHFVDGRLPLQKFPTMTDDQIIAALTAVHGIGVWTAEMFLMFVLVRPDIFPLGDLGIRRTMTSTYRLTDPKLSHLRKIAEPWRPYRTIACWYLWQSTEA